MTAFASAECTTGAGQLACELRSVNHRFLELGVRLPDELRAIEPQVRERVAARIGRGKLEFSMRLRAPDASDSLAVDETLVARLSELALDLSARFPNVQTPLTGVLQWPGVLRSREVDAVQLQAQALALVDQMLDGFVAAREREGERLAAAILERAGAIDRQVGEVRTLVPLVRIAQRARLDSRIAELATGPTVFEPGRLEQELVLALQKLDVDEELDRLESHLVELRRVLGQREPMGRRLDFLLQEFNREANTLGSKSVDVRTTNAAVELKVLIDQIREQVQNIE